MFELEEGSDDWEVSSRGFTGVLEGRHSAEGSDDWEGEVWPLGRSSEQLAGVLEMLPAEGSSVVIRCCATISSDAFVVSGLCGIVARLAAGVVG